MAESEVLRGGNIDHHPASVVCKQHTVDMLGFEPDNMSWLKVVGVV